MWVPGRCVFYIFALLMLSLKADANFLPMLELDPEIFPAHRLIMVHRRCRNSRLSPFPFHLKWGKGSRGSMCEQNDTRCVCMMFYLQGCRALYRLCDPQFWCKFVRFDALINSAFTLQNERRYGGKEIRANIQHKKRLSFASNESKPCRHMCCTQTRMGCTQEQPSDVLRWTSQGDPICEQVCEKNSASSANLFSASIFMRFFA